MSLNSRIGVFSREISGEYCIPVREDLFLHQIKVLDRDYRLEERWKTFNAHLDHDFEGDLDRREEARNSFINATVEYCRNLGVASRLANVLEAVRSEIPGKIEEDLIPGHTYLCIELENPYDQVVTRFGGIENPEFRKNFTDTEYFLQDRSTGILGYCSLSRPVLEMLSGYLLRTATEDQDCLFLRQVKTMRRPIVQFRPNKVIYDITNFGDTFYPFEGPNVLNSVKVKVSVLEQESLIFYYNYALYAAPVTVDLATGRKDFLNPEFREFLSQLACLDQDILISEKDLWWQDQTGLHRHNKPIRKVFLGPETVVN